MVLAGWAFVLVALAAMSQTISPLNLPLYFEANNDQTEFLSRGNGYQFLISASGARLALRDSGANPATAQMQFPGANANAQIHGDSELPGKINYLIGDVPSKWQTSLPTFSKVQITGIYPGINLVFHGNGQQLEYDFAIAPGANPDAIKIHFNGVSKISLTPDGDLVLKIGNGVIGQPRPEIYQTVAGARNVIAGGYKMVDDQTVSFEIGNYDHSQPLVIDPVLSYSTFFGGDVGDTGWAIARDTNNNTYIAGQTFSKGFYTIGAKQTNFAGGKYTGDAFVAEFDSTLTNLVYLTYLGGSGDDAAYGLAVDGNGDAYIAGFTQSTNFPVTNAIPGQEKINGVIDPNVKMYPSDAIVAELAAGGSNLVYSTYLGGETSDAAYAIALDSSNNAYVTGFTGSTNFPVTADAFQDHLVCSNSFYLNANAFVTEIASGGGAKLYSTYLGGTNYDVGRAIAVDASNYVYVAGYTLSTNFPVWHGPTNFPALKHLNGTSILNKRSVPGGFVTKFPPLATSPSSLSSLVYSTYLGGTNWDIAYGVAADSAGVAYVTGSTSSTNFPDINKPPGLSSYLVTNGVANPAVTNAFLTKIAPDGSSILASAVFGGRGFDIGYGVAVDANDNAFVVGSETSFTNFPTTNTFDSLSATNHGGRDVFVASFNPTWSAMNYSVILGGKHDDEGYGIALDASDNAFITGKTTSTNFPTQDPPNFLLNFTNGVVGTNHVIIGTNFVNGAKLTGTNDAFLAEILFTPIAPVIAPLTNQVIGVGGTVQFVLTVTSATPVFYQWQRQTNSVTDKGTNLVDKGVFSGVTSNILTITNAQTNNTGTYQVIATYAGGSVTDSATLTVVQAPVIELTNEIAVLGDDVSFNPTVFGVPPFHYQWMESGSNLVDQGNVSGVNTNQLTFTSVQTNDVGTYFLVVTNSFGAATNSATLTVLTIPTIITPPPANLTVTPGTNVSLSVVAIGTGGDNGMPLFYEWQEEGVGVLTNGGRFSGATNSTFTISDVQTSDSGTYTVYVYYDYIVNGFISEYTSASTVLTVVSPSTPASITNVVRAAAGQGLVLSGSGGPTNGTYMVLTSSNLFAPLNSWSPMVTDKFDTLGNFIFTNTGQTNSGQFFILKYTNSP